MNRLTLCIAALLFITGVRAGAAEPNPNLGTISGIVTGADGKPAAGREINLYSTGQTPDAKTRQPKPVATVKTNEKGQYALANIPSGPYRLVAGIPFKEMALANVTVKPGGKITLNLTLKARRVY
jgi:hypothetical protein